MSVGGKLASSRAPDLKESGGTKRVVLVPPDLGPDWCPDLASQAGSATEMLLRQLQETVFAGNSAVAPVWGILALPFAEPSSSKIKIGR